MKTLTCAVPALDAASIECALEDHGYAYLASEWQNSSRPDPMVDSLLDAATARRDELFKLSVHHPEQIEWRWYSRPRPTRQQKKWHDLAVKCEERRLIANAALYDVRKGKRHSDAYIDRLFRKFNKLERVLFGTKGGHLAMVQLFCHG